MLQKEIDMLNNILYLIEYKEVNEKDVVKTIEQVVTQLENKTL